MESESVFKTVDFGIIDFGEGDAKITSIVVNEDEDKVKMEITLVLKLELNKQVK